MSAAESITATIKLSKETKNTYRYDAVDDDAPAFTSRRKPCPTARRPNWSFA